MPWDVFICPLSIMFIGTGTSLTPFGKALWSSVLKFQQNGWLFILVYFQAHHCSFAALCCYCCVPPLFSTPPKFSDVTCFYPRQLSVMLKKLLSSSALPSSASVLFFTLCFADKVRTSKRSSMKESFFSAFPPISVRPGFKTFCLSWNIINSNTWRTASRGSSIQLAT